MKNNLTLWAVVWAMGFIILNCYWYDRHDQKLGQLIQVLNQQCKIEEMQDIRQKYNTLKSFIEDAGITDEKWLNNL